MPTTYIQRTPSTTGTPTIFTYSVWFKRGNLGAYSLIGGAKTSDSSNYKCGLYFNGDDRIQFEQYGTGLHFNYQTWRQFKDTTAWYHLVVRYDSTDGTGGDRIKMYINGVEVTDWKTETDPGSSQVCYIGSTQDFFTDIGNSVDSGYFDGEMSHVNFIDGTAYDASTFGSTNATDGMWEINTAPSVTYGTNGFFLKMEDSSNLDLDSGTNTLTFTTSGTLISTKDTPSNNLATNNYLMPTIDFTNDSIASIGNRTLMQTSNMKTMYSTLGVEAGKWYAEFKLRTATGTSNYAGMGIVNVSQQPEYALGSASSKKIGEYGNTVAYFSGGAVIRNTSTVRTDSTFTSGDIISIAMDCDNGFVYWAKNNTWQNSGDPTSGATGTGGYNFFTYLGTGGIYVMGVTGRSGASSAPYFDVNWGNGAYANANFGSPNADGNGFGAFSYAPPTGFLTMCTKNISTNG